MVLNRNISNEILHSAKNSWGIENEIACVLLHERRGLPRE